MKQVNTTNEEINFLNGIVDGKWVDNPTPARARQAIKGYIDTLPHRRWDGAVDINKLRAHATGLMEGKQ